MSKPKKLSFIFLIPLVVSLAISCHDSDGGGGGPGGPGGCGASKIHTGNKTSFSFTSGPNTCNTTLKPYWNETLKSLKNNGFNVEKVNINSEKYENYDFYRITADQSKATKYEELLTGLTNKLETMDPEDPSAVQEFCTSNLVPNQNCPNCVNDLIAIKLYDSYTASYTNCMKMDEGCNLLILTCKTGNSYFKNSNGFIPWSHNSTSIDNLIKETCINDISIEDGYLVFPGSVLNCLTPTQTDQHEYSLEETLKQLCSENTIPRLYTITVEPGENDTYICKNENDEVIECPDFEHVDIRTPVWNNTKLKLTYPQQETRPLPTNKEDLLSTRIPASNLNCSFED